MKHTENEIDDQKDNPEFLSVLIGTRAELPPIQHLTRYFDRKLIERAFYTHTPPDDERPTSNMSHSPSTCSSPSSSYSSSDMAIMKSSRPTSILDEYALIDHGRRLTFGQFRRCYRRLAHLFRTTLMPTNRKVATDNADEKLSRHDSVVVGVAMQPSIELVVTLFGLLEADCLFVPVDVTLPAERMHSILADAQVNFIITDEHSHSAMASSQVVTKLVKNVYQFRNLVASERDSGGDGWDTPITLDLLRDQTSVSMPVDGKSVDEGFEDDERRRTAVSRTASSNISPQLAAILYTSGSTGTPKGVPLRHASLMNMVQWRMKEMPFWSDEVGKSKKLRQ